MPPRVSTGTAKNTTVTIITIQKQMMNLKSKNQQQSILYMLAVVNMLYMLSDVINDN